MNTTAIIPIRKLSDAKQRLAGVLDAETRLGLFRAMVEDVLTAVESCVAIDEVAVVTNDPAVSELAAGFGAYTIAEPESPGLINAVTHAAKVLTRAGVDNMVFLPGDVPLVTPEELEVVLEGFGLSPAGEFTIVPANDLGGSNCVACSPPDCIQFAFGEDSFRKHLAIARQLGINAVVTKLPGIGLDVDTMDDLAMLIRRLEAARTESYTYRFLRESGVIDKMTESAQI